MAVAGAARVLSAQAAIFAVLLAARTDPWKAVTFTFLAVAAFEAIGGLPRAGALAGHAAAAARRVLAAAQRPASVADPIRPHPAPSGSTLRFEAIAFRVAS